MVNNYIMRELYHSRIYNSSPTFLVSNLIRNMDKNTEGSVSSLLSALLSTDEALCVKLINNGANPHFEDKNGMTLLSLAIVLKMESVAVILLSKGVKVDSKDKFANSPLHLAVDNELFTCVEKLLEAGADVNAKNNLHQTPLGIAFAKENVTIACKLIEYGADVRGEDGHMLLLMSVIFEAEPLLDTLIEKGAPLDFAIKCTVSITPLEKAIMDSNEGFVKKLLEYGADANARGCSGAFPLHWVFANDYPTRSNIVDMLIQKGAKVNVQDPLNGATPLHLAVKFNEEEAVVSLLNAGADLYSVDKNGNMPYLLAFDKTENDLNRIKSIIVKKLKMEMAHLNFSLSPSKTCAQTEFETFQEFQEVCLEEIERMKAKHFGGITLHTLFSYLEDPSLADNNRLVEFLESGSALKEFPQFTEVLLIKLNETKKKNKALKEALMSPIFEVGLKTKLPEEIARKIFCYLSLDDLENLSKVEKLKSLEN